MQTTTPTPSNRASRLGAKHLRRVALLLTVCGWLTATMTLGWTLCLLKLASWQAALIPAPGVAAGLLAVWFASRGRPYIGGTIECVALYTMVCLTSLFLDQTTDQMPRTTHLFLVPLATGTYMGLRGAPKLWRHGIVAFIFLTFVVLACTSLGGQPAHNLPDELRIIGGKVNTVAAAVAMYLAMHIMQADVEARNAYESDLREAVRTGQLAVHYQPQVDQGGRMLGAEALLRWPHPRRGMISPGEFIPLAEKSGLILPMGEWVLDTACAHLAELANHPDTAHLTISVNISVHQIRQPDFVVQAMAAIERHKVDPQRLKMELTESVFARDMDDLITKMKALKQYGVSFSLDDFGTGYSSLSYLKRLPLDQLKIDQAFVRDLLTQPRDLAIAKTIVDLGTTLNMAVMAEGVETREQHQILEAMGCRQFQGYLFGKPMPMEALREHLLRTHALTPMLTPAPPAGEVNALNEPRSGAPVHA
jgi:EAL domain-containing protein (putative c-di-GMP-specific phosphodiesterase class I)